MTPTADKITAALLCAMMATFAIGLLWGRRPFIALIVFLSRPFIWVGEWLNDYADARTARLWRTCPWCGHDAEKGWEGSSLCASTGNSKTTKKFCKCHHHGPKAWYKENRSYDS